MNITFPITIDPLVFSGILAGAIILLGGFSITFLFHWRSYGMETPYIRRAPKIYLSVTGGLCAFAIISYFILIS